MTNKDLNNEGKEKVFLDIDRIINEGLAGGSVNSIYDKPEIDEARELEKEDPTKKKQNK